MVNITWAYGVQTCKERVDNGLLARTLKSLHNAGFPQPRLFVDGVSHGEAQAIQERFGMSVTSRWPMIRTYGNWLLMLLELYIRDPVASYYAIFQDDLLTYPNLRLYLEKCRYNARSYWNLYTFPENQAKIPPDPTGRHSQATGWFLSNQRGRGAVALIFANPIVVKLLSHHHTYTRMGDRSRGWQAVDGAVVTALNQQGIQEFIHNPSLVQHTGQQSSMGHPPQKLALSFRGEEFDALKLVEEWPCHASR